MSDLFCLDGEPGTGAIPAAAALQCALASRDGFDPSWHPDRAERVCAALFSVLTESQQERALEALGWRKVPPPAPFPVAAFEPTMQCGMEGFCGIPDECRAEGRCCGVPPAQDPTHSHAARCPYCLGSGRRQVLMDGVHVELPCTCPAGYAFLPAVTHSHAAAIVSAEAHDAAAQAERYAYLVVPDGVTGTPAPLPRNPYSGKGSMAEAWQRGYEARPMLAAPGSDYARAYAEGKAARGVPACLECGGTGKSPASPYLPCLACGVSGVHGEPNTPTGTNGGES